MTIDNKVDQGISELKEIFIKAINKALEKTYIPKSIRENYSISINKKEGKIYLSSKK